MELTNRELHMVINGNLTGLVIATDCQGQVVTKNKAVEVWSRLYHETLLRKVEN